MTFLAIVNEHGAFLERYIRSRGVEPADVGDVLQDVYVAAYRALDRFDAARGDLRTWLVGIAFRQVALYRRHARRHPEHSHKPGDPGGLPDARPDPGQQLRTAQRAVVLQELLRKVPPERAAVLLERLGYETPFAEIATSEGVPIGTVKTRARLGWKDVQREKRRWQARTGNIIPVVLAGLLATRRAWAAAARTLRDRKLLLKGALGWAVFMVLLCIAAPIEMGRLARYDVGVPHLPDALDAAPVGAASAVAAASQPFGISSAVAVSLGASRDAPPQPTVSAVRAHRDTTSHPGVSRQRRPPANEPELYQRARAALRARNYDGASSLFDEHATEYPERGHAGERDALAARGQRSVPATMPP